MQKIMVSAVFYKYIELYECFEQLQTSMSYRRWYLQTNRFVWGETYESLTYMNERVSKSISQSVNIIFSNLFESELSKMLPCVFFYIVYVDESSSIQWAEQQLMQTKPCILSC